MGNNRNIKIPPTKEGKRIKAPVLIEIEHLDYPVFCFKHVHKEYGLKRCTHDEQRALVDKLFQLSQMTWQSIQFSGRHGAGSEKIARSSINVTIPPFITEDVDHLFALRFDGKKPILIHRNRFIMHIIFIDNDFTVYNH